MRISISDDDSDSGSGRFEEIWVTAFTEASAQKFREELISQSRMDNKRPLTIYIDSYGGLIDSLAKMIETMDQVSNPILTVCLGKAMSCGAVLLSHGDLRFCGPHSRVMIHEVSNMVGGDVHDIHNDTQETKRLNKHFLGLLAKNSGFKSYEEFRKWIKDQDGRDRYLNAEEAVKFGIVDSVGIPRIATATVHEVRVEKTTPSAKLEKGPAKKKSESRK